MIRVRRTYSHSRISTTLLSLPGQQPGSQDTTQCAKKGLPQVITLVGSVLNAQFRCTCRSRVHVNGHAGSMPHPPPAVKASLRADVPLCFDRLITSALTDVFSQLSRSHGGAPASGRRFWVRGAIHVLCACGHSLAAGQQYLFTAFLGVAVQGRWLSASEDRGPNSLRSRSEFRQQCVDYRVDDAADVVTAIRARLAHRPRKPERNLRSGAVRREPFAQHLRHLRHIALHFAPSDAKLSLRER